MQQNNQCQGGGSLPLECDEKADSNGGDKCCFGLVGGNAGAQCDNNCNFGQIELCKLDAPPRDAT